MTETTARRGGPVSTTRSVLQLRHSAWVRATHWVWVVALTILLMSGCRSSTPIPP